MIAHNIVSNIQDWWENASYRLKSDYSVILFGSEGPGIRVAEVPVFANDFALTVGGWKCDIWDLGENGSRIYDYAFHNGGQAFVEMYIGFKGSKPYVFLDGPDGDGSDPLVVLTDGFKDTKPGCVLPESTSVPFLDIVKKNFVSVILNTEEKCRDIIDSFYKQYAKCRKDELVNNLACHLIDDEKCLSSSEVYKNLFLLDDKDRREVFDNVMSLVSGFHSSLYEEGHLSQMEDVTGLNAVARSKLESYFSSEVFLLGRLSFRLENIGNLNREVQTDDIARIAVLAQKDSSFSPIVGEKLEKWVSDECKRYRLNKSIVNSKRITFGGAIGDAYKKPSVSEKVRRRTKKSIGIG